MKKLYVMPTIKAMMMEQEELLAESLVLSTDTIGADEEILSRQSAANNAYWDDEE